MLKINREKVAELKNGRTNKIIAQKVGCTETHITQLFLGNKKCSETLAKLLILTCTDYDKYNLEEGIKEYFQKV